MKKFWLLFITLVLSFPISACELNDWKETKGVVPVFVNDGVIMEMRYQLFGRHGAVAAQEMITQMEVLNTLLAPEKEGSDVYKINRMQPNTWLQIDKITYDLINTSKTVKEQSGGLYDPAVYPLAMLWQVRAANIKNELDYSLLPTIEQVNEARTYCNLDLFSIKYEKNKYFVSKSDVRAQLELGSIAKGYGADVCKNIADRYRIRSGIIDISGNNYLYKGKGEAQEDWVASVETVRGDSMFFMAISAQHTSIVCSNDINKYYTTTINDVQLRIPHIINPLNGLPLNIYYNEETQTYAQKTNGTISSVIFGTSSTLCDAYSTATVLMDIQDAITFLQDRAYDGILITEDMRYALVGEVKQYEHQLAQGYKDYELIYGQFI